ncbi:MAG TPA: zf-HC2 domain-containing protein [Thermoanaerobaculia bacterium]|nr:zf-HC2 domain-containing protein [Thermoanaerobaculia bacterium]
MTTTAPVMMTCPTEETLAAFIDGKLYGDDRDRVVEHLAECSDCRDAVVTGTELAVSMGEAEVREFRPKRRVAPVVAAVAAGIVVVMLMPPVWEWIRFKSSGGLAPVVAAYEAAPERTVQSRFSGFAYKDFKRQMRGPGDEEEDWAMTAAESQVDAKASRKSWRELRALAIAHLLSGHRDEAVHTIELASKAGGDSSAFLNDAAAVYIEKARYGRAEDLTLAVQAAERAWQSAKTPESAWNLALAYEIGDRDADALRAWQEYLKLDSSSPWAKEAQDHVERLQELAPLR